MDNFIGYLTLKTRIDTTDLRPQIEKTKNDIKKLKEQLDVDYGEDIINAKKEYNKIIESLEEVRKANPYPEQKRDIKELSKAAADALKNVRSLLAKQREAVASRTDINAKLSQAENRLAKLNAQQEKVEKSGIMNLKKSFEDGEKSLSKLLRRMAKYVLAVFGIRSAFMAVRNAINVISQNDAQLKADIDYMKNALAYTLEPIIRKIVEWAKLLMFYVGYIVKAWTGKNIWENANKSLKGANKEAKKLQKTLASFDEINVLNEQHDAGGGTTTPSFDLTAGMDNMKKPDWLEWIVQNKDDILFVMEGIGLSLLAWKLGLDALTSLGFGLILVGIVESVKSLLDNQGANYETRGISSNT